MNEVWIGDVGQDKVEEIDRVPLEFDEPPKNLGWSGLRGHARASEPDLDRTGEIVWPVAAYEHGDGCSVTGGPDLPRRARPRLCGPLRLRRLLHRHALDAEPTPEGRATDVRREKARSQQMTHIGTDADGELRPGRGRRPLRARRRLGVP